MNNLSSSLFHIFSIPLSSGIQVVCCGDFFQLPPVGLEKFSDFCFKAPSWNELNMNTVKLTEVIRQSGDTLFIHILNELRVGIVSTQATALFRSCHVRHKPLPEDGIVPTKLFCTNRDVDSENIARLQQLTTPAVTFPAHDELQFPNDDQRSQRDIESLVKAANNKVPTELKLKIGAQIVLLRNLRTDLVNGSRGIVIGFHDVSIGYRRRHHRDEGSGCSSSSSSSSSALMDESKGSSQETSEQHRKRHKTNSKAAPMSNNNVDVLWSGNGNTEPTGRLWTMLTDATGPVLAPLVQFSNGRIAGKKF